jgi:hypothetical protein
MFLHREIEKRERESHTDRQAGSKTDSQTDRQITILLSIVRKEILTNRL